VAPGADDRFSRRPDDVLDLLGRGRQRDTRGELGWALATGISHRVGSLLLAAFGLATVKVLL
jgi:hypothetical protein